MSDWKYFTDEESIGMSVELCRMRDAVRELYGGPIEQTCGYRSPEHNAEIGGVPGSAHTTGLAWDMKAPADLFMQKKLAWALGKIGFARVEFAPKHFHADIDDSKPTPCCWEGDDH